MPRKGRQVELRHIFPWVAAPYIELLRVLWRIERFVLSPFQYLQAWTISAFFGIAGILLSVSLFIPRLVDSQAVASSTPRFSRLDMPYIPFEEPVLPPHHSTWGEPDVHVRIERTILRDFDLLVHLRLLRFQLWIDGGAQLGGDDSPQVALDRAASPGQTSTCSSLKWARLGWSRFRWVMNGA